MVWTTERKHPRVRVVAPGELHCPTEEFPRRAQTANLSVGGCYFEMLHTLEPRTGIQIILWLDGVKIRTCAEVVSHDPHVGNGIRFIHLAELEREKLVRFLDAAAKNSVFPYRVAVLR